MWSYVCRLKKQRSNDNRPTKPRTSDPKLMSVINELRLSLILLSIITHFNDRKLIAKKWTEAMKCTAKQLQRDREKGSLEVGLLSYFYVK